MMSKNSARSTHRVNVENEMIKRREREYKHQSQWNGRVDYYKTCERASNNYQRWTSPRYYEENTELIEKIRKNRDKEELLKKRKERLLKLYQEEDESYKIELMIKNRNNYLKTSRNQNDDIPTEILNEINDGLKIQEDNRRRHQAELSLYKHWRQNSHAVRNYERTIKTNDIKLSWLDQQIKKRMEREKEEEECRKILAEREKSLKRQKEEEEAYKNYLETKNKEIKEELDKQIEELEEKKKISDELKLKEQENVELRKRLYEIEEMRENEETRRKTREIALYNIKQHKMKLKQRARDIEENIENEKKLAEEILKIGLIENLENENRKQELQQTLKQFVEYSLEQKQLEKKRQQHLDFIFDSEAKLMYEKQCEIWENEERTRGVLFKDVLETIKKQIQEKEDNNKIKYLRALDEREEVLNNVEKYNNEMEELKQEELRKNIEYRNIIDKQIKERDIKKKKLQTLQRREIDRELEMAIREEERIKNEIMKLQMRQGPVRHPRSRILF